jgi:uncharacterized protein (TIGR02285 family)
MQIYRSALICTLMALCAVTTVSAQDKPVMTWLQLNLPPGTILVDGKPTNGTVDQRLRLLISQWPQVQHEFVEVNTARLWQTLAQADSRACTNGALITPERERQFYNSATHVAFALGVVGKAAALQKMSKNRQGEVLPAALFDRNDLTGLIQPARSYSPLLDALLVGRSPGSKITQIGSTGGGANLLRMIATDRADYTLESEPTMLYLLATDPALNGMPLQFAPLAGGEIRRAGVVCPRNAWGYATIHKIDGMIAKLASNPSFQNRTNQWTSVQTAKRMKTAVDAFYAERASPNIYSPP